MGARRHRPKSFCVCCKRKHGASVTQGKKKKGSSKREGKREEGAVHSEPHKAPILPRDSFMIQRKKNNKMVRRSDEFEKYIEAGACMKFTGSEDCVGKGIEGGRARGT